jgi:predicted nucleic acid-binding protein
MISLDTNVIVRVVTRDHPEQLAAALAVMRQDHLWLCKTVLLETAWVLRFSYGLERETITEVLRKLLGYRRLLVEDRPGVLRALSWHAAGLDLADALHLASCGEAERFVTFDRRLATGARGLGGAPAVEVL